MKIILDESETAGYEFITVTIVRQESAVTVEYDPDPPKAKEQKEGSVTAIGKQAAEAS